MIKSFRYVFYIIAILISLPSFASPGLLFKVNATGIPASISITLCLNAKAKLGCQNFKVNGLDLAILTTIPKRQYDGVGIKVNTPGFSVSQSSNQCTPLTNGYCTFNVNDTKSKTIWIDKSNHSLLIKSFDLGVASFEAGPDNVILWTHVKPYINGQNAYIGVKVSKDKQFSKVISTDAVEAPSLHDYTAKIKINNLNPHTRYYYQFFARSLNTNKLLTSEIGQFVTAPDPTLPADFSFVISGDSNAARNTDKTPKNFYVLSHAARKKVNQQALDFFIYFGDTIYSDLVLESPAQTLNEYRQVYQTTRQDPHLQEILKTMSSYVGWDDHEFYDNYPLPTIVPDTPNRFKNGAQAFFEYLPMRVNYQQNPKTYRRFRWGKDVEFFFTDGRQYRSPDILCFYNPFPLPSLENLPGYQDLLNTAPQLESTILQYLNVFGSLSNGLSISPFPQVSAFFNQLYLQAPENKIAQAMGDPSISLVYWVFRLSNNAPNNAPTGVSNPNTCVAQMEENNRTMLGQQQLRWLKDGLAQSDATWRIVVNTTPFLPNLFIGNEDNWDGFEAERKDLYQYIGTQVRNPEKVIFLTTDSHTSLLKRDPNYKIVEIIAGPIAAETQGNLFVVGVSFFFKSLGIDLNDPKTLNEYFNLIGAVFDKATGGNPIYSVNKWIYDTFSYFEPDAYGYTYIHAYRDSKNRPKLEVIPYGDRNYALGKNNPNDVISLISKPLVLG